MTSEANASIVRATIGLAKGLHLKTVAEGVETRAQADFLVKHRCDVLQGFLFARPMEPAAFMCSRRLRIRICCPARPPTRTNRVM